MQLPVPDHPIRVGISGTGFVARGLCEVLMSMPDRFLHTSVLTRRPLSSVEAFPNKVKITNHLSQLIENSDVVVECSGTVEGARQVVEATLQSSIPTVTMNAEFQVTLGSAFAGTGLLTEAQGDQPGSLAALNEEVRLMGFEPLVLGSQKGFLNHSPSYKDMQYWATRQGISVPAVTAFTDGTKVQIEQAMVADCFGVGISGRGLNGPRVENLSEAAQVLGSLAKTLTHPIADYALCPSGRGEVFIVATHSSPPEKLGYYKLGAGDLYLLERPFHLGHFEIPITIERMAQMRGPLMSMPKEPLHSVLTIAKRDLGRGLFVTRAIGSFDFRGEATTRFEAPNHVPIGLMENCILKENVLAGQVIQWSDVDFQSSASVELWQQTDQEWKRLIFSA
ncbi:L-aspartate dehydrogenase [Shimia sp. SK013]|uniref:hypothetical protein n=1 Tax=Shimia sp. SK013 TaxID=1389006 RepID=UPI0006CD91B8|nr:hypothetical protein [Shimia sp. SK013]KPA20717.1 L-aspartate dehydrogenase [Shimia sp. SK013]